MAEFQLKKFSNLFARISDSIDSRENKGSHTEIYEEIKNQIREEFNTVYEEWKNSDFDPNFRFKLYSICNMVKETTLLNIAVKCRSRKGAACIPLVQCLLDHNADPNIKEDCNLTPLSAAVSTEGDKNKEVVELLLGAGADPNLVVENITGFGTTPLFIACRCCQRSFNVETMELLLKNGADPNKIVDDEGNTVLHELVQQSFGISDMVPTLKKQLPDLIKLLIKYGANIYARNNLGHTPGGNIDSYLYTHGARDRELVFSVQRFLKKQEDSLEYHKTLFKLVDENKDLRSLANIIQGNGPISASGIQVCSQVIPKILGIPGIKIIVKAATVEGEVEQEFSQGTGWPVIEVNGNLSKYFDLLDKITVIFPENPLIKAKPEAPLYNPQREMMWKISRYIRENFSTIKKELWGEYEVDSTPKTEKKEDNVRKQDVAQKESSQDDQDTITPKFHEKKKTVGTDNNKTKMDGVVNNANCTNKPTLTEHSTFNSDICCQKEAKDPPISSRKQKIAIAIAIAAALTTALSCYLAQFPIWAIVISALVCGIGAYIVSSKLQDVFVCNGTSQQPEL